VKKQSEECFEQRTGRAISGARTISYSPQWSASHYFTYTLLQALAQAGAAAQIRIHDLRHTRATLLLSKNVNPKIVSEMLGHATIAITLDTYSHVLPTMQESAARAMEDALS
jgi:integrase